MTKVNIIDRNSQIPVKNILMDYFSSSVPFKSHSLQQSQQVDYTDSKLTQKMRINA